MFLLRKHSSTSNILRVTLRNSSTGAGLTGLAYNSAGLIISTICDNEASATSYTAAGSTIETISTLGTFAAPTATKCRFKEVDSTNHPGLYEIQIADARFAVASAKTMRVCVTGASSLLTRDLTIQLTAVDPDDAAAFGMSSLTAVKAKTDSLTFTVSNVLDANALYVSSDMTAADNLEAAFDGTGYAGLFSNGALTESYAASGATFTVAQALYGIWAYLCARSVSGTTLTTKKLDGSTTAMTFTLDSANSPTGYTRTS